MVLHTEQINREMFSLQPLNPAALRSVWGAFWTDQGCTRNHEDSTYAEGCGRAKQKTLALEKQGQSNNASLLAF